MNCYPRAKEGLNIEQFSLLLLFMVIILLMVVKLIIPLLSATERGNAPQHRPLWMGPDLTLTTEAVREAVLLLLAKVGQSGVERHPASDELAQHHAYAMAARGFCCAIDPEGEGPAQRLGRLHPKMVISLLEWDRSVDALSVQDAEQLAELLLAGPDESGQQLASLLSSQPCNILGVSVSGSASRATLCIVAGHHWATLVTQRPQIERAGTWPVGAELAQGTKREQLSAALLPKSAPPLVGVTAEPFSDDQWDDERICVYPTALGDMEGVLLQWYRDGVAGVPVNLP